MQNLLSLIKDLTLHPQNISELKGLILQLAIQGKLTQKWREENPELVSGSNSASALLAQIQEEKGRLIKEKKIKKEKPLPEIEEKKKSLKIPEKWVEVRLGDIGDWGAGATPSRSNSALYGGSINWFKSGELNNGVIDYDSKEKITEEALTKASLRLNKPGDVLIAMYGATIGKTGLLMVSGTTNQAVCACTVYNGFSNFYLLLLLKGLKQDFLNQGEGGAQPNISRIKIRNKVIGLPPLEEQIAIVHIVDELFKEVDELAEHVNTRTQLKEDYVTSACRKLTENTQATWRDMVPLFPEFFDTKPNIKKLRETILQLAVQGKLTASWRKSHPELVSGSNSASALLEKIKLEKEQLIKEKKIKKEKPLPKITEDEIPFELPDGWEWCRLKELGYITGGGTPSKAKSSYWNGNIPWVSPKDMKSEFIHDSQDMVTIEGVNNSSAKLIPKGSLLIVGRSGILARTIPVSINDVECTVNQDLKVLVPYLVPMNVYLKLGLKGMENRLLRNFVKYGMTVHSLKYSEFELLTFPLPPFEEQKAIVEKVNTLMALCDQLEEAVETSESQVLDLMKSVVREATSSGNVKSYERSDSLSMAAEESPTYNKS